MIKTIDTKAYCSLWIEAQQWIRTNIGKIVESDLESEDLASKFVHVAAEAYYSNGEDYFPNRQNPLGLETLQPSRELALLLRGIKTADRHGYATTEIREYEQTQKLVS